MAVSLESLLWLTLVGCLWGGTNPFLKKGTAGMKVVEGRNIIIRLWNDVYSLFMNWKYMVPFLLNQSGSVVYFLTLQNTEMSLAVPIANSLTFVFTAISGWLLSESMPNKRTFIGIALVLTGISLCVLEKSSKLE